MSYCVNCGVELAESEKVCPLCHTEVINPKAPWKEPRVGPYPPRLERVLNRIDRKYVAAIVSILLEVPVFICILCDLLGDGALSWSGYVLASALLLLVWVVVPLYFSRFHGIQFLALDGLATLVFLAAVNLGVEGEWFLPLAAPVTLAAFGGVLLLIFFYRQPWGKSLLSRFSLALLVLAGFCLLVEVFVDLYALGRVSLEWSLFVLIPCLLLALLTKLLDRKEKLKQEILKRMFY